MKTSTFCKAAVVALTTVGMCLQQGIVVAAPQQSGKAAQAMTAADVKLADGVFSGRVVDHTGHAVEGSEVVVRQGKSEVARAVTDGEGHWSVKNVKSGVYTASAGNTDGLFRVWAEQSAPPVAKDQALLVMGENGARGQFGSVGITEVLIGAAVIGGLVLGIIAVSEINNVQNDVDRINRTLGN